MFANCPVEVWTRIFSFVDPDAGVQVFPLVCKRALKVAQSPSAKALFFLTQYGRGLAFYSAYHKHRRALDPLVARVMLQNGALLPRFVAQKVIADYHMQVQAGISTAMFVFFVNHAFVLYGDHALFKDNDHALFERLVRAPLSEAVQSKDAVRTLINDFRFTPVADLCVKPLAESIYFLARLDLGLVADLARHGFDLRAVSDNVMERVMLHPYLNTRYLKKYLEAGFVLSDLCVKRALASGRAHTISVLHTLVDESRLRNLAFETIEDLFGPYLDRNTSLNVAWSSDTVQRLIHTFSVPDAVIARALLTNPESTCTFDRVHPEFPVTRSYLKSRPYPIWQWILTTYGPHHPFSVACMDDALSRAVADQELHELHDMFLDAGFVLRPRHIKILACRVLHRNMTANALHLFRHLRDQVLERQLKTSLEEIQGIHNHAGTDDITCISEKEVLAFRKALSEEVVDNQEWATRMRTIQLEGGPRGGAIRIERPPEEGLRFLEDARKLIGDLHVAPPSAVTRRRNTLPRRRHSSSDRPPSDMSSSTSSTLSGSDQRGDPATWIKKVQAWWRSRTVTGQPGSSAFGAGPSAFGIGPPATQNTETSSI
ncbi:hypothetical protein HK105_202180 [Polyrhizophydium stewartii]|uniref:F-box domain-containing protein n=1 Tax=Polyrhizophydium stewartii TaxID=2732419 RepID=A0ABR4NFD9_9FUNG|nr:hypothetical protein HK105_005321 [Polyrhizophydium stewartii]